MDWGRIFKNAGKGMAGRGVGAFIGQILIPIPGVGAAAGAFIGGWAATGKVTSGIVGIGFLGDAFGVAGDVVTSATSDVVSSAATDVATTATTDAVTSAASDMGGSLAGSVSDVSASYADVAVGATTPADAGISPDNFATSTTNASFADTDGSLNVQGNPNDTMIHGGRPTDVQGNELGRNGQGNVPTNVLGWPSPA